jgi:tetratricopeptide (TPR) repeat protein
MITRSGIKILDFGLATLKGDETLTGGRMVLGTPAYMAPEQREGKPADARTDIYSLGCVFYEMLTSARVTVDRKPASPASLEKIVSRCLEADPSRRWQSAVDLEAAISAKSHAERNWVRMSAAAAVLAAISVAGSYFLTGRTPGLTEKDTIVLADFVNTTGDPIFDGTLRQGLAIQLEQSPFLKIMDDERVQRVVTLMSLPRGARITNQIAREICVRDGAAATIDGAIANLGKDYVITLQAIRCQDGATLAREQVQARDKEHVLNAVGAGATAMRRRLGESLQSIQQRNQPLEQATTSSLEALQTYTQAISMSSNLLAIIPLFERAIEIDPNFAMAYYLLGVAYEQAGDMERSAEYAKKAFDLVGRVSSPERTAITAYYYRATGEVDKEMEAWKRSFDDEPSKWRPHNQLSLVYIDLGRYEEGLNEGLKAAAFQPDVEPPWRRVLDGYICLDRLAEAKEVAEKVRARGVDGARIHQRLLEMAYVEGDQAAISREIQWFAGKPEEYLSLGLQAASRNVHGQRRESHNFYQRAADAARRHGLQNGASEFEEADALADALSGECRTARGLRRPALALAICGDAAEAEKLAAQTSKLIPNGTIWNAVRLPAIRAASAISRGQAAESVDLLQTALPYERSYIEAAYLRGLAYLRLRKGAEAQAEFAKIIDHKGLSWGATWVHPNWGLYYSLSWLGMARGAVLAGDTTKAREAFQNFLENWKAADSELAPLRQAKAEYARLR